MRKSFTRFFGLLLILLISMTGYSAITLKPTAGSGNQKTNLEISATYDGNVTAVSTKYVRLYDANGTIPNISDDTPLFVKPATDSKIVISGSKVTFNFNDLLKEGHTYYVAIDAGAFQVGGVNQPVINQESWSFSIGDWTAPVLATTNPLVPADGAVNQLATIPTISITFNEPVKLGTPISGTGTGIYLMKDNGTTFGNTVEILPSTSIAGVGTNTLTFTLANALLENSNYYILVENGAIVDNGVNANKFPGFIDEGKAFADKQWGFSTKDFTAPVVSNVIATATTTTSITVSVTSNEAGLVWVDYVAKGAAGPASITSTGKKLTFSTAGTQEVTFTSVSGTPTEGATLERDIWVGSQTNINATGVAETPVNAAGVDAAALALGAQKTVKLIDGINPTLATPVLPNSFFGVAKDAKMTMIFSEEVKIASGKVYLKKQSDNSTFFESELSAVGAIKQVGGVNKSIEITFPNYNSQEAYYILMDAGAVVDLTGNAYAGIATGVPQQWKFTAGDFLPPVATIVPGAGADIKVSVTNDITITFNENILHNSGIAIVPGASVNAGGLNEAFELYENGTKVAHTWTFNGTNAIKVVPTAGLALKPQKTYRLIFYAYWVEDLSGNEVKNPVDVTFTTKDEIPPVITAFGPASVGKTSNLTVTFSEAIRFLDDTEITNDNVKNLLSFRKNNAGTWVNVLSSDFSATISADKKVITLDPAFDLPSQGQYRLTVSSNIEDLAGNALSSAGTIPGPFGTVLAGAREFDYTVSDYIAPVLTLTPANNASVVASATSIIVGSSENVTKVLGGGNMDESIITLKEGGINGQNVVFPATAGTATNLTLAAGAILKPATTYYLSVDASVKDASGNINAPVAVTFTTQSVTAPNLASYTVSPANAAKYQAKDVTIKIDFKEPVANLVAGGITVTGTVAPGAFTGASLSADKKTLTITHSNLASDETYTVNLPIGTLTSETGTPQTAPITWSFGTYDTVLPTALVYSPALAGTPGSIAVDVTPTVTFSEEVKLLPTAYAEIHDAATDYLIQTITGDNLTLANSGTPGVSNDLLKIKLLGSLAYGKSYYIFIAPNTITDVSGNNFAGMINKPADGLAISWDFACVTNPGSFTIDTGKSSPKLFADKVDVASDLNIKFNRAINSVDATKTYRVYQLADYNTGTGVVTGPLTIVDQYSVVTPSSSFSGDTFTINPGNNLTANKWYVVRFEEGFLKDVYGTGLSGASLTASLANVGINPSDILFYTGTIQGPVATISPADAAKDVAKSSSIVVTFDKPFFKADGATAITVPDLEAWPNTYITVNSSSIGALKYNATISGNSIVLKTLVDFPVTDGEKITVTVLANSFYNASKKAYDKVFGDGATLSPTDDQAVQFSVVDQTGPIVTVSAGAGAASGTKITYQVQSNEKGFVYSLVKKTSDGTPSVADVKAGTVTEIKATGTPSPTTAIAATGLDTNTTYTIWVVGIDAATSPNTGALASFSSPATKTPDDVPPVFVKNTPANGEVKVAKDKGITFEYNENIVAGVGYVVVREKVTQDIVEKWDVTALGAGTSNFSAKKLTLNLGAANGALYGIANWASEATYVVTLDAGAVKDVAGNKSTSPVSFEFTAIDFIAPTIVSTTPAVSAIAGVAPVSDGQGIKIKFSENVFSAPIVIRIYEERGAGYPAGIIPNDEIETIDPNTVAWNSDNTEATFNVSAYLLKDGHKYYIAVDNLSFKDDGGNYLYGSVASTATTPYPNDGVNAFQFATKNVVPSLTATHVFSIIPTVADQSVNPSASITVTANSDVIWTKHPYLAYIISANSDSILGLYDANGAKVAATLAAFDTNASGGVDRFTITPKAKLADASTYTVKFNDIQDVNGNKVVNYAGNGLQFNFTTGDGTAPKIAFNPKNKTTETSEMGPFVISFDEPIYATTGIIPGVAVQVIDNNLVGNYVDLIDVASNTTIPFTATISADYKTITITPKDKIAQNAVTSTVVRYGLKSLVKVADYNQNQITAGVLDAATVSTDNAKTFAETTIRDYKEPLVVAYSPIGVAATDVAMTITFNENVAIGSGNLYIRELVSGNILQTITADGGKVTVDKKVVTIAHANLPQNTKFYVTIDKGFITDVSLSKNLFAGISDSNSTVGKTWTFNTADKAGPGIVTLFPAKNATEVLLDAKLRIGFDKPVQAGTGNIVIYESDGTPFEIISITGPKVDFNSQYSAGGGDTIVTISHNKFSVSKQYFVRVDAGAITDKAVPTNAFAGILDKSWIFTTEDYTPATYTIINPLVNSTVTDKKPVFQLNFSRAIQAGTDTISLWKRSGDVKIQKIAASAIKVAADGKSATFTFANELPDATDLYVIVPSSVFVNTSVSHVPFVGITTQWDWSFKTGVDVTKPSVVSVSPKDSTSLKPADIKLVLTLNEDVVAGLGNIVVYNAATDAVVSTVAITPAMVSGHVVTVTPTGLAETKTYYVKVDAGALIDKATTPNAFAGILDKTTWKFKIGDYTGPKIVSVSPSISVTAGVKAADVKLVLTLDEPVKAVTGNIVIYSASDDAVVQTIAITPALIEGSVVTASTTGLVEKTAYYVKVDAGSLTDKATIPNPFAGITDKVTWKFTTNDFTAPTVTVIAPVDATVPVKTVFNVDLKFNESVTGVSVLDGGVTIDGGKFEVNPTVVNGVADNTKTLYTVTVSAKEQTKVTITLTDAIKDLSGNKFAGPKVLTYTTGDFTKPELVSWSPTDGVTISDNHPILKMSFTENVVAGEGGYLKVYKMNTTTPVLDIPITFAMISGKDVTVNYTATKDAYLEINTRYYVTVDGLALKDNAGNKFDGVTDASTWTFKTGSIYVTDVPIVNASLEFKVYPNPFVDYVNVDNASQLSKVVVTNIAGQIVKEVVNPTKQIQLNELRSGYYFISLYNMDNVIAKTVKIVKR